MTATVNGVDRGRWYAPARIGRGIKELRRYPVLPVLVLLLVLVIPAIFADVIAPFDPIQDDLGHRLQPPGWVGPKVITKTVVDRVQDGQTEISLTGARTLRQGTGLGRSPNLRENVTAGDEVQIVIRAAGSWSRPLGTDSLGRDILSRMIHAARVSLIVALLVIAIAGVIGTVLGMMAAYFGGWVDYLISRIIDISLAIPGLLIALVLVVVVGTGMWIVIPVIVAPLWSVYARLVRGETLAIKWQDYIARARVAGSSDFRIIVHHLFPNVANSLIVLATLQVGFVIIIESVLSFLGAGVPRPTPTWGSIVSDGRDLIIQTAWWVSLFPGIAIALTVLSVNLLGDWLRDKLDPKLRHI